MHIENPDRSGRWRVRVDQLDPHLWLGTSDIFQWVERSGQPRRFVEEAVGQLQRTQEAQPGRGDAHHVHRVDSQAV